MTLEQVPSRGARLKNRRSLDDQPCVVVPAKPRAALVVTEVGLSHELLVVELDLPAQPSQAREAVGLGVLGQVRDPARGIATVVIAFASRACGASWSVE
jgi:hypothetical protein